MQSLRSLLFITLIQFVFGQGQYADWTVIGGNSGTCKMPLTGWPSGTWTSTGSNNQVFGGANTFLNKNTPPGAKYGSSQDRPYLLQPSGNGVGSTITTTLTFNGPVPPGSAITFGDIDAEKVQIVPLDKDGQPMSCASVFPAYDLFNYCQSGSPVPGNCKSGPFDFPARWDPATCTCWGKGPDVFGASCYLPIANPAVYGFRLIDTTLQGNPSYQTWISGLQRKITGTVTACGAGYGKAGQTINLLDENDNVVATTTTDTNGNYAFNQLASKVFRVQIVPTSPFALEPNTQANPQTVDTTNGDVVATTFTLSCPTTTTSTTQTTTTQTTTTQPDSTTTSTSTRTVTETIWDPIPTFSAPTFTSTLTVGPTSTNIIKSTDTVTSTTCTVTTTLDGIVSETTTVTSTLETTSTIFTTFLSYSTSYETDSTTVTATSTSTSTVTTISTTGVVTTVSVTVTASCVAKSKPKGRYVPNYVPRERLWARGTTFTSSTTTTTTSTVTSTPATVTTTPTTFATSTLPDVQTTTTLTSTVGVCATAFQITSHTLTATVSMTFVHTNTVSQTTTQSLLVEIQDWITVTSTSVIPTTITTTEQAIVTTVDTSYVTVTSCLPTTTSTKAPQPTNWILAQTCKPGASYDNPKNCCCAPGSGKIKWVYKTQTVTVKKGAKATPLVKKDVIEELSPRQNDISGQHLCSTCPLNNPSARVVCCLPKILRKTKIIYKTRIV